MTRFVLTRAASRDIREIYAYIAAERLRAARSVRERIFAAIQCLAENPGIGHTRKDLTDKPVAFWPASRYVIVYDPTRHPIRVIRVLDGARDLASLL
jgi:plasmid stabilization system protein ParE